MIADDITEIILMCHQCPLPCTHKVGWNENGGKLVIHQSKCIVFPSMTTAWVERKEQQKIGDTDYIYSPVGDDPDTKRWEK